MQISASDRSALLGIIERFPRQRIVLVGDLVADEFILGEIARVSREAPVLILKQRSKQILPGGGANAASNLADLGARVTPVGVVGDKCSGCAATSPPPNRGCWVCCRTGVLSKSYAWIASRRRSSTGGHGGG